MELYERLSIVLTHLKLADQALEEQDETSARSFLLNASATIEHCREIIETYGRKNNSIGAAWKLESKFVKHLKQSEKMRRLNSKETAAISI